MYICCSLSQQIFIECSVPGTVLSARHTMVSKTHMASVPMDPTVLLGETNMNKITKYKLRVVKILRSKWAASVRAIEGSDIGWELLNKASLC